MKKIIGILVFIVSSLWLLAVQAHPLVVWWQRAVHPRSASVDKLSFLPYPPPFSDVWWPVILGLGGVMFGVVLIATCQPRAAKLEEIEFRER